MAMLTPDISVESQLKDENSILRLYRKLGRLRNTYPAIARGEMSRHPVYNDDNAGYNAIAAWYMTNGTDKMLVIHNLGKSDMQLPLAESVEATVFLNGSAGMSGKNLNLGAYSSAVLVVK